MSFKVVTDKDEDILFIFTANLIMDQGSNHIGFYERFIRFLYGLLKKVRLHKGLFILCLFIGAAPYTLLFINNLNTFEATFTVSYEELVRKIYGDRLIKLNTLINQHKFAKVSSLLGVNKNIASSIISVKATNILGEELSKDLNTDRIPFIVTFKVKDSSYVPAIQNGIAAFLETGNDYMLGRKIIKVKEIAAEIGYIDQQIAMIDTLKRKYNNSSLLDAKEGSSGFGSIYEFSYDLYKKKSELRKKQQMPDNIQIVDDAIVSDPSKKSIFFILILGGATGLILFFLIAGIVLPVFRYKEN